MHLLALTTAPSFEVGQELVRSLVEQRVVACGTILPGALSIYRWRDTVEETAEVVILLKTTGERWDRLVELLTALHPYEVPELIAMDVARGHAPYLEWLSAETGDGTIEKA